MKNLFYPYYIKYLRDTFYIGQSKIADSLYYSISAYSKMEQGKKFIHDEDFSAIVHFYEQRIDSYNFCFDEEKKAQSDALIRRCIVQFTYRNQKEIIDELKTYLDDNRNFNSFAFFDTKLLETVYEYFIGLPFQERLPFLLEHIDIYDSMEQSLIYDLCGLNEFHHYKDTIAIEFFQKAKSLSLFLKIPGWLGLIDYHLIITYLQTMKLQKAFSLFEECGRDFQTAGAHRRLLDLQFNEARYYLKSKLFEEADEIFDKLLQTYTQVENDQFLKMIYGNYSWSKFLQKNYNKAIILAKNALKLHSLFPDLYITLTYSFYKLGQINKALTYIEEFRSQDRNDPRSKMVLKFLEVLESFLLKKPKTFERLAKQLLSKLNQWQDLEIDLFLYQMLIDFYKTQNDEHNLCIIQEQLIQSYIY